MSYYSSKHPGLYLYLILVVTTLSTFIFLEVSAIHIGILSIFWGLFTAIRALSLYEINTYLANYAYHTTRISKEHNSQSSALAHDLIHRMSSNINMKSALKALYCMHERTILWFALASIYTIWQLQINAPVLSRYVLMENICTLFMIGTVFWGGHSYAHDKKASSLMLLTFTASLCTSLYFISPDYSSTKLYTSLTQLSVAAKNTGPDIILLALGLYSAAILLYAFLQKGKDTINALSGIFVIALLSFYYLSIASTQADTALWISGWGLFSVYWTRAHQPIRKRYVLYQSE